MTGPVPDPLDAGQRARVVALESAALALTAACGVGVADPEEVTALAQWILGGTPGACADAGACPGTVVLAEDVVPMYADAEPEGVW